MNQINDQDQAGFVGPVVVADCYKTAQKDGETSVRLLYSISLHINITHAIGKYPYNNHFLCPRDLPCKQLHVYRA